MSCSRFISGLPYRAVSTQINILGHGSRSVLGISRPRNVHTITQSARRAGLITSQHPPANVARSRFYSSQQPPKSKPSRRNKWITLFLLADLLSLEIYRSSDLTGLTNSRQSRPLNLTTFVPFTITSKDQISPTAFILTVQPSSLVSPSGLSSLLPPTSHPSEAIISSAWDSGRTWSVEIKQPQLQVAREYTPLPLPPSSRPGELRFLIRRLEKGEVSSYLSTLAVGDEIELRGPHLGFDIASRLDGKERIVFLAGGTGIAPALQVVKAVEEKRKEMPRVDIIWANRSRRDCVGCAGLGSTGEMGAGGEGGPVMDQLMDLQRRYPGKVTVRCAVDEEGSFIDAGVITRAAGLTLPLKSSWGRRQTPTLEEKPPTKCWIHDQERVALRPATETDGDACEGGEGRNLLFVSGPDGFVEAYAGAKRWAGGMELQGPLGGLVGELARRYPEFGKEWLVLKL